MLVALALGAAVASVTNGMPPGSSELVVTDFGAVADGRTDNAAAFRKVSRAARSCSRPCTVTFPSSPSAYRFSGGLAFDKPVYIQGALGASLEYVGSGTAITLGRPGMSDSDYDRVPYVVERLTLIGGASMRHGIYIAPHVPYVRLRQLAFLNFGNPGSFAVFSQADTWDLEVSQCDFLNTDNVARNFVRVAGVYPNGEFDMGNSRLRFHDNHVTILGTKGGVAVWVDGYNPDISHNKIEGGSPNVRLGSWANFARITDNYFEVWPPHACVEYGDPSGPRAANFLLGVAISGNYANLHGRSELPSGSFVAPTVPSRSGLRGAAISVNAVAHLVGAPLVAYSAATGQDGNEVSGNIDGATGVPLLAEPPPSVGAVSQRILHARSLRDLQPCSEAARGLVALVSLDGDGDRLLVCKKSSAGTYLWEPLK
jgi:hypothetical protein